MLSAPAPPKKTVEVPLALEGFCPVMLCVEERWVTGNPAYNTMYQGHLFRFSSREALVRFAQNPANYVPVAMGEDIVLKVDRNRRVNGEREFGAWYQGRVFLFSSQETFDAFGARPDFYTEIALKYEIARREQPIPIVY
jgi:YHS domain-containing protein